MRAQSLFTLDWVVSLALGFLLFFTHTAQADAPFKYKYDVVASTGQAGLTAIDSGPSINDMGNVAFIGTTMAGQNLYSFDGSTGVFYPLMSNGFVLPLPIANPPTTVSQTFGPGVQINNNNKVIAQRRMNARVQLGFPSGPILLIPLSYVEQWDAMVTGLPTQIAMGDGGAGASGPLLFFLNPILGGMYPSPFVPNSEFSLIKDYPTINNANEVVFTGQYNSGDLLASQSHYGNFKISAPGDRRPVVADNATFVLAGGGSPPTNLRVLSCNAFNSNVLIAGPTNGFTRIGLSPGISNNGNIVIFYGESNSAVPGGNGGPGIYAAIKTGNTWAVSQVAEVGKALTDDFSGFYPDARICVSNSGAVIFLANRAATGQKGIWYTRIITQGASINTRHSVPVPVAEEQSTLGETVPLIEDLDIYDCINNHGRGQVAFWIKTALGQAVIRATPQPLTGVRWGARVEIAFKESLHRTSMRDFLVKYEDSKGTEGESLPGYVTLQSGIDFDAATNTALDTDLAKITLADIDTMTVLPNTYDPTNPQDEPQGMGFDMHILIGDNSSAGAANAVAARLHDVSQYDINQHDTPATTQYTFYSGGRWHYTIQRIDGGPADTASSEDVYGLVSIPLYNGQLSALSDVRDLIKQGAANHLIPPQVLYAVGWRESGYLHRWQQFQNGKTVVTYDGGIGLFQLTQGTALYDANPSGAKFDANEPVLPANSLSHLFNLSSSLSYNVNAGATVLAGKFNHPPTKKVPDTNPPIYIPFDYVGDQTPQFLEHWYYAVKHYNGGNGHGPYADAIFNDIRQKNPPDGYYPTSLGISAVPNLSTPSVQSPSPTPFPAHADADFDGIVDVEISKPSMKRVLQNGHSVIHLIVTATLLNGENILGQGVNIRGEDGQTVASGTLSNPDINGLCMVDIQVPDDFQSGITYKASLSFKVQINGTSYSLTGVTFNGKL